MTDQALRALVVAAETAHGLGEKPVNSYHLLVGLSAADGGARHAMGLDSERLRGVGAVRVYMTAADVVERARVDGSDRTTTTELLRAVLDIDEGAAALLRDAGSDTTALAAALDGHRTCCGESGDGDIRVALGEIGSRAEVLPGRGRAVARAIANLLAYLLLGVVVLAVTWETSGPEMVVAVAGVAFLLRLGVAALVARRRLGRALAGIPAMTAGPDELRSLRAALGLRELEIRVHPGATVDRCHRWRGRGWVVVSEVLDAQPEALRFVLWHEMAHLARRDGPIRAMCAAVLIGLGTGALLSFDLRAMLVVAVGGLLVTVASYWWSESACDRIAVRQAGPAGMRAWADLMGSGSRWGWLTHPPTAWRIRAARAR